MILAKETTKWEYQNHTYLLSDDMWTMYGYFKNNDPKEFKMFKKPIKGFDKRYRTFKVIQKNLSMKEVK